MKTLFSVQKIAIRQAFQNPAAASFNLQPRVLAWCPQMVASLVNQLILSRYLRRLFSRYTSRVKTQTVHPLTGLIDSWPSGETALRLTILYN